MDSDEKDNSPDLATDHSTIAGVSVRAWLAILTTATVCGMSMGGIKVEEPLYTLVGMIIGFYFAQNNKPKTP